VLIAWNYDDVLKLSNISLTMYEAYLNRMW